MNVGDRIEMVFQPNDPDPIRPGDRGRITRVMELPYKGGTQYGVKWDSGRTLSVIVPPDTVRLLDGDGESE